MLPIITWHIFRDKEQVPFNQDSSHVQIHVTFPKYNEMARKRGKAMNRQIQQKPFEICIPSVSHPHSEWAGWRKGNGIDVKKNRRRMIFLVSMAVMMISAYAILRPNGLWPNGFPPLATGDNNPLHSLSTPKNTWAEDAGMTLLDIQSPEAALSYHVPRLGVYVLSVSDGSPAKIAGIEPGDCISELNGSAVQDAQQVLSALQDLTQSQSVTLTIIRGIRNIPVTIKTNGEGEHL
jgi:membrane-associated protease RseP (regulator of RpoE activity)